MFGKKELTTDFLQKSYIVTFLMNFFYFSQKKTPHRNVTLNMVYLVEFEHVNRKIEALKNVFFAKSFPKGQKDQGVFTISNDTPSLYAIGYCV